jgi:hypothetical protein
MNAGSAGFSLVGFTRMHHMFFGMWILGPSEPGGARKRISGCQTGAKKCQLWTLFRETIRNYVQEWEKLS